MSKSINPDNSSVVSIRSILVLDDDAEYHELCERELLPRPVRCVGATPQALVLAREHRFDLALIDLFLVSRPSPDSRERLAWGLDAVEILRAEHPALVIIVVSGGSSLAFAEAARDVGANATVPKQFFSPRKIVALIEEGKLAELERSCMPRKPMSLARAQREHLTRVYIECDCNASRASSELGISRNTLYRKLRERGPAD